MVSANLVAVVGPTACGKSELAHKLALRLGGEIVNYDSLQVYRGLDIGTAKSVPADVPAHLFDVFDPREFCTAGEYARRARGILADIHQRGRTPVLAGGTGLYPRALPEGPSPGPERDDALRRRLERRPSERLHRLLARLDRASAARIHPRDKSKLIRAIEVCVKSGRPMSKVWAEGRDSLEGFRVFKIGLDPPRAALYDRINARAVRMFEGGLLDEVRALRKSGVPETARPLDSLGYREAICVLGGRMTVAEAIESTQRRTRQYAKRQMTWFRRERDVHWIAGFGGDPAVLTQALACFSPGKT